MILWVLTIVLSIEKKQTFLVFDIADKKDAFYIEQCTFAV